MNIRPKLRKNIDKTSRLKQYFLRGHNSWFALAFSLMNFTLIFYNLLFFKMDFIPSFFKSYSVFVIIFGLIYFPVATLFGFLDFKKGTYAAEQTLSREISPIWREVFARLDKLETNDQKLLLLLAELDKADD